MWWQIKLLPTQPGRSTHPVHPPPLPSPLPPPPGREAVNAQDLHANMDVDAGEEEEEGGIRVQEIDAYWLQRRIARAYGADIDADRSQELAEQVCGCV